MDTRSKSLKHWLVLATACAMSASSIGINLNVIGVFYTPVSESLGVLRGTFAMHATIASIALAIISLYFSPLLHKFGWKPVITSGIILASLSTIAMAFSRQLSLFYILGFLRGLGAGLYAMVPLSLIINNWFEEKRGLAMSLSFGFSGIAGAIFSPVFTSLIQSIGWERSFIVMGALMFILASPAIFLPYTLNPKDSGYLPYGYQSEEDTGTKRVIKKANWDNFSLTHVSFILLALFTLLHTSLTGIPQHFPGFAESIQLSPQVGGVMLSAVMVGNISFKLMTGFISDYIGITKATLLIIVINFIATILLLTLSHPYLLVMAAFLFGSVYSVPSVSLPLLTTEFFGMERYVQIFPIISFVGGIGGALSMSVVGYVFDFTGFYTPAFMAALIFHVCNSVMVSLAKRKSRHLT